MESDKDIIYKRFLSSQTYNVLSSREATRTSRNRSRNILQDCGQHIHHLHTPACPQYTCAAGASVQQDRSGRVSRHILKQMSGNEQHEGSSRNQNVH